MPEPLTLNQYGLLESQILGEPGEPLRERGGPILDRNVRVLEAIIEETTTKALQVSRSRDFTAPGRARQLEEIGNAALSKVDAEGKTRRQSLDAALEQARKSIPGRVTASDVLDLNAAQFVQIDRATQVAEFRQALREADPALRAGLAREAAEDGNACGVYAVESLPAPERFRLGLDVEALRETYWRAVRPERYAAIEELERILQLLESNTKTARRAIGDATGCTGIEDTTAANARTTVDGRPSAS